MLYRQGLREHEKWSRDCSGRRAVPTLHQSGHSHSCPLSESPDRPMPGVIELRSNAEDLYFMTVLSFHTHWL